MVNSSNLPHTRASLADEFSTLGLAAGQTVIVHSSMKQIGGWIIGGAQTVIEALLDVLGMEGTLMMPTHTTSNTEPSRWQSPPIPPEWWQIMRETTPPFDPAITPTRLMGALAEQFRTYPGVVRSQHPVGSFAAKGRYAAYLTANHDYRRDMFGDESPIGKLYQLDGCVMLLGVGHGNDTSLHLAEYRANWGGKVD
ncbi:MAG TPA: AAC(3) family N-acetyltransferase, partial [Phototrophicaceae bacterium]|nr:AAC(3) family N-acetyltransferase [Phototrophicaceae bacterium]